MLVIIGNRYKFSAFELNILKKKFKSISFKDNFEANKKDNKLFVLNSFGAKSDLENKIINVEDFLENYLFKILLDEQSKFELKSYNKRQKFLKKLLIFLLLFFYIQFFYFYIQLLLIK